MFKNTANAVFLCLIVVVTINVMAFWMTVSSVNFGQDTSARNFKFTIFELIQYLWLFAGIGLAVKAIAKKEPLNLLFKVSTLLLLFFLIFSILSPMISL
ncbi:MAG: hypothetical protein AAFQ94_10675 [Bacteroidota bacterium]